MKITITETEVLRFIYGECSSSECKAVVEELKKNPALQSYYDRMLETKLMLAELEMEPDHTAVNEILDFSASHHDSLEHH
ncbi:MAG: hypothetical protein LPK45_09160 [Bacteroidota bacterium]|nr:hypothetical protein [Bacteroidota bacterium]MDX5431252.1 hypothetical protein [Bacteroidota bacterium]MDX5469991.1 hypothetical protein [Bacteroidota bacterium]